jgi:2-polyprenyl-3-methyl-5-hydroxy-6-metoxy-1,4-benzoquinol methylase
MLCPICGAESSLMVMHPETELYRCSTCTHAFSDVASMKHLEAYDPSYFEEEHRRWFDHPNFSLFARIAEVISKTPQVHAVLDVGCGRGDFLRYLKQRQPGLSLTGIDLSPNESVEGITFVQGEILTQAFEQQYDAVVSLAVIEHIADVKAFARRLAELTRPAGLVIVMTLNESSLLYRLARTLRSIGVTTAFDRLYSKHHIHHFTARSLEKLLTSHGLEVKERIFHNAPLAAIDIPSSNALVDGVLRTAMWGICLAGDLTNTSYLQTMICWRQDR